MCCCAFVKTMIVRVFVPERVVADPWLFEETMKFKEVNESTKKSMKVQRIQWLFMKTIAKLCCCI